MQNIAQNAVERTDGDGAKTRRINPIKLRQMQERVTEIEEEIAKFEAGISECETALASFVSVEETQRQTDLLSRRRSELEALMAEWEELSATIEGSAVAVE